MGFFGKLFDKKVCDICGGDIGLLGNRKLEDGNCCKECAGKLSPWFDERRHSTVAQINEQLAYRSRNAEEVKNFRVTQVIGENCKMYIEEINGVPSRFMVTSATDYMNANPDIISFRDVLSCTTDIRTHETELKDTDDEGNRVSYNPPRFETDFEFYIDIKIANNPYFDDIRFKVNSHTVTLESGMYNNSFGGGFGGGFGGMNFSPAGGMRPAGGFGGNNFSPAGGVHFTPAGSNFGDRRDQERYSRYMSMCQEIESAVQRSKMSPQTGGQPQNMYNAAPAGFAGQPQNAYNAAPGGQPQNMYNAAPAGFAGQPQQPAPQAPAGPKFCPNCGSPAEGGKFCQACGSPL